MLQTKRFSMMVLRCYFFWKIGANKLLLLKREKKSSRGLLGVLKNDFPKLKAISFSSEQKKDFSGSLTHISQQKCQKS